MSRPSRHPGRRPSRRSVLLGLLAAGACTSPEPTYYTLAPQPPARDIPLPAKAPRLVELRRPGLAGYLDRPEIVRAGGEYQLRVAGGERWGEPLGDLIGRVMAENLTSRLPGVSVFTQAGGITSEADVTIELDIQRFDAAADGSVLLLAQVAVRRGRRGSPLTRTVRLQSTPGGRDTRDVVAGMSAALGELSDAVADLVRRA